MNESNINIPCNDADFRRLRCRNTARLLEKESNMYNYSDFVWNKGGIAGVKKGKAEDLVNLMKKT